MKMKKVLALLMASAMTLSMVACGTQAEQGGASADPQPQPAASGFVADGTAQEVVANYLGKLVTYEKGRDTDSMAIGVYVQNNEVVSDYSLYGDAVTVADGAVDISGLDITAEGTGFTAIAVQGTEATGASTVNIKDVNITATDDSDGTNANDFSGLGSIIVASGASEADHITMNIDNLNLTSTGFERDPIVVDDYADAIVTNSKIVANGANPLPGGDAYAAYRSSAAQSYMLSPPWILGITGGARAANVLGNYASLSVIDSYVEAGAWAVLSTDDCTEPVINTINTELAIAADGSQYGICGGSELFGYSTKYGSGYGTYAIGDAVENFYGTTFTGVTYATILTGGRLYYGASENGLVLKNGTGSDIYTYAGEAKDTVVNGVWGVMDHQGGSAVLDKGSVWNTEEAVILKKGTNESSFTISGAELNPASGIIYQLMDDDDGYGATPYASEELTYDGTAWGMPTFPGGWRELAEAGLKVSGCANTGAITQTLTVTEGEYTGDVINGAGSGQDKDGNGLAVTIDNATLNGAITSAASVHGMAYSEAAVAYLDGLAATYGAGVNPQGDGDYTVKYVLLDEAGKVTEDASKAAYIQFMEFTISEQYMMGHMINKAAAGATTEVVVADGATWNVTSDSYLTKLEVADGATVNVADGATLYVDGKALTGTVAAGTYGKEAPEPAEGGMGMMMPPPGGDASGDAEEAPAPTIDTSHKVMLTVSKR